jgi:hypothetical protein
MANDSNGSGSRAVAGLFWQQQTARRAALAKKTARHSLKHMPTTCLGSGLYAGSWNR